MAQPPLTFLEKKWASGGYGASDSLIRASRPQMDRPLRPFLDNDTHRNVSAYGRRVMMSLGRWLYWNVSAVRGAINEMASLAVSHYVPQFEGEDQEWGEQVEGWMFEHDKICNVRDRPYTMATLRRNAIIGTLVDGDQGIILAKTATGYPVFQSVAAHRIGTGTNETEVKGGAYDGYKIIDGVIVGDQLEAVAYRVLADTGNPQQPWVDIPARDMILCFDPPMPDQVRGISEIAAAIFDWEDVSDARRFELIAQKLGASIGVIETNETGEADKSKKLLSRSSTGNFDQTSTATKTNASTTATETVDGVTVRYHRAGSGSKIEAFRNDRPTANQQAFRDDVIREALAGMGWSFDFSLNPTKAGGAQMRIIIEKVNRRLEEIRDRLIGPLQQRMDGYRISKAVMLGLLPKNSEWYKWSYQGPADLTADQKYSSDVDLQERTSGRKTLAKSTAQNGDYWRDVRKQKEKENDDLLTRAGNLAKRHGISIELALTLMQDQSDYSTYTNSATASANAAQEAATGEPATTEDE